MFKFQAHGVKIYFKKRLSNISLKENHIFSLSLLLKTNGLFELRSLLSIKSIHPRHTASLEKFHPSEIQVQYADKN